MLSKLPGFCCAAGTWTQANATIGPGKTHRYFYSSVLPTTFFADGTPDDVTMIVSYKTPTVNVTSYVESIPDDRKVIMIYHHEPENDYATGAQFVEEFVMESALIRSCGRSNVRVAHAALCYRYPRNAGDGSFLPPPAAVDIYTADVYQFNWNWPTLGLSNFNEFQDWYTLVKDRGKPWGITEYGIGSMPGLYFDPVRRNARIQIDAAYLTTIRPFEMWSYWWENRPNDIQAQFTDAATIATWKGIETRK